MPPGNQRRVRVRYERWRGEQGIRTLEPLGVVLKAGTWYVVAGAEDRIHTYRASRILDLDVLDERFERPDGFDLAEFWQAWLRDYEVRLYREEAHVRLSPRGLEMAEYVLDPVMARAVRASAGPPDDAGWASVTLPTESAAHAVTYLLRLGAEAEVLGPPELRARMAETAEALARRYRPT